MGTVKASVLRLGMLLAQERYVKHMAEAREIYDRECANLVEDRLIPEASHGLCGVDPGLIDPDLAYYLGRAREESRVIQRYKRQLREIGAGE